MKRINSIAIIILVCMLCVNVFGEEEEKPQAETYRKPYKDPGIVVDIFDPEHVYHGTNLFAEYHDAKAPRIVEANMGGGLVWQYFLPDSLRGFTSPGFEAEWLWKEDHILCVLPLKGVYEIDREGEIVWSYLDDEVAYDADRLINRNTLVVCGGADTPEDIQVKEVDPGGNVAWQWSAKQHIPTLNDSLRKIRPGTKAKGWTNANAATRLENSNTLINLPNFNLTVEVSPEGEVLWSYDWSNIGLDPQDPEIQPDGNLLVALYADTNYDKVVELNRETGEIVWEFHKVGITHIRDADKLENGNVLITEKSSIIEVTPEKEVVWQLKVGGIKDEKNDTKYLFKTERVF